MKVPGLLQKKNLNVRVFKNALINGGGIIPVILAWVISVIIVNPQGEFPLNDDWAYLDMLKGFYYNHHFIYSDWISSTLISQILWAFLFCKIFGYKILVARVSTLVSTLLISIVLYNLIHKITSEKKSSILITAVFVFNPVLYVQSFTFMTESSVNLAVILCILFSYSFLRNSKIRPLLLATLFGCIAVAIKQPGLIIAAILPLVITINELRNRRSVFLSILSAAIVILFYFLLMMWINPEFSNPERFHGVNHNLFNNIKAGFHSGFSQQLKYLIIILMYLGFFILPLSPVLLLFMPKTLSLIREKFQELNSFSFGANNKIVTFIKYFLMIIVAFFCYRFTNNYPLTSIENIFYNLGLGPILLRDTFIMKVNLNEFSIISRGILHWISFFSLILGILMILLCTFYFVATLFKSIKSVTTGKEKLFQLLFISSVVYIVLLTNVYLFDRYILLLLSFTLIMYAIIFSDIVKSFRSNYFAPSIVILAFILIFEVLATHDYLAWNRAKWDALNDLTESRKISPEEIDGGYEFNGMHNYDDDYVKTENKSWWWVHDDKYIIAMGMLPGYNKVREVSYRSWLSNKTRFVLVLERAN